MPNMWQTIISMAKCKTAVTPLLTHWSYCSLALSHQSEWRMNQIYEAMWRPYATMSYIELMRVHDNSTSTQFNHISLRSKADYCGM